MAVSDIGESASAQVLVTTVRRLPVPSQRVFEHWVNPRSIAKFLFMAAAAGGVNRVQIEPRPGGRYEVDEVREGRLSIYRGAYLAVERPRLIIYTMEGPQKTHATVTVEIKDDGDGSVLQLTQALGADWAAQAPYARAMWEVVLTRLEQLVVSAPRAIYPTPVRH